MKRDPKKFTPRASDPLPLEPIIERYWDHLRIARGLSRNTVLAYRRDIGTFQQYLRDQKRAGCACRDAAASLGISRALASVRTGGFVPRPIAGGSSEPLPLLEAGGKGHDESDSELAQYLAREAAS